MRLLETWVESPLVGAIGWTLLHSLWEGAILAVALGAALAAMRPARARYAAACLALLIMLGAFSVTLIRLMPESVNGARTVRVPAFHPWNVGSADAAGHANTGLAAAAPWLTAFWVAGVWIYYLVHAFGWIAVCRMRRRGVSAASEQWQKELARLGTRLRLSRPVLLLESCLAETPMVLGHFRPVILMPLGLLAGLPAGQMEAILLHELAHIRRNDYLVNVLQRLAEGLLFYHPAVWWISRVIRAEREHCCDDVAVGDGGDAHQYAVALAALEQNRWPGREPAVAATGGNLMKRIHRLLYPKGPNSAWTPVFAALILIATASAALQAWQSNPPQPRSATGQAGRAEDSPYVRWLDQDVAYIISDEERAAFQKLATDEERTMFIQQFWERRDPTPGTVENEFKLEHYRRIAYANRRFQTLAGRPGWQTDRGHMWIVYGPPDELEEHPQGSQTRSPYQVWLYWHVEGIGDRLTVTFIDRTGTRDYRLAPGSGR